jgi:hypothetical protein
VIVDPSGLQGKGHEEPRTRSHSRLALYFIKVAVILGSGADQFVRFELNGRLAVGVNGEVRMELGKGPCAIRSVRHGSEEVRVGLYEHVAVLDGPDVFRIANPEIPRVARTGPIEGHCYNLGVYDLVEVQRPGLLEEGEVHQRTAVDAYGVELVLA